ncbi:MAG: hypothetical protein ACLQU9_13940, partial [Acidimicrobiales bacterium]
GYAPVLTSVTSSSFYSADRVHATALREPTARALLLCRSGRSPAGAGTARRRAVPGLRPGGAGLCL